MTLEATRTSRPALEAASPAEFREAMSSLASGVVIVTSWLGGRPWGTTVTSFVSVSAEPPTILVSLCSETTSARAIDDAGAFGASILGRQHWAAARHGAAPGAAKFLERFTDPSHLGLNPSIAGALAHLDCDVVERVEVADHTIFIGRVRAARVAADRGAPLLYFRRAYRTLTPPSNPSTIRRP